MSLSEYVWTVAKYLSLISADVWVWIWVQLTIKGIAAAIVVKVEKVNKIFLQFCLLFDLLLLIMNYKKNLGKIKEHLLNFSFLKSLILKINKV